MTKKRMTPERDADEFVKSLTPEQNWLFRKVVHELLDAADGDVNDPAFLQAVAEIGQGMQEGYIDLDEQSDGTVALRMTEKGNAFTDTEGFKELVEAMKIGDAS